MSYFNTTGGNDPTKLPLSGGTLTGQLVVISGSSGTPAIAFTGVSTSGIYASSASNVRSVVINVGGTDILKVTQSTGASSAAQIGLNDWGTYPPTLPIYPQISLASDPTTGTWYGVDSSNNPYVIDVVRGVPTWVSYRAQGDSNTVSSSGRFGAFLGINGDAPVLEVVTAVQRPKVSMRSWIINELGDTSEAICRFANGNSPYNGPAFPYTDAAGLDMHFNYGQSLANNQRDYDSTDDTYEAEFYAVGPLSLAFSSGAIFSTTIYTVNSGVTNWTEGRRYHFLWPTASSSGTNPQIVGIGNTGAWAPAFARRNDGTSASANYWFRNAETTFIFSSTSGQNVLYADLLSGSDNGGLGRHTSTGFNAARYPYFGRSAQLSYRAMATPLTTEKQGQLELASTPPGEIGHRVRAWVSQLGFTVVGGITTWESGTDGFGYYNNEAYPGQLLQSTSTSLRDPPRNLRSFNIAPGPMNPVRGGAGWGNLSIAAPNIAQAATLAMRRAGTADQGLDWGFDYATSTAVLYRVISGTTTYNITSITSTEAGLCLVTTSTSNGILTFDTVRIISSNVASNTAFAAYAGDPDGLGYLDGVHTVKALTSSSFIVMGMRWPGTLSGSITGSVAKAQRIETYSINYSTGTHNFANSLRVLTSTSNVNYIQVSGSVTSTAPYVRAQGSDSNISLRFLPRNNGLIFHDAPALTKVGSITQITSASDQSYTAAQIVGGLIIRDCNGGARTDTLPTASSLVAAIPNVYNELTVFCYITNGSDAAETITISSGAGGAFLAAQTAVSRVIPQNTARTIGLRITNISSGTEAYQIIL